MTSINNILNDYLGNKRIPKQNFDDLKTVTETIGFNKPVLDWFSYLHSIETIGWRTKLVTQKLARILKNSNNQNRIEFYALFCPSYKKGKNANGFRTDDVGVTSLWGLTKLEEITKKTEALGFPCNQPRSIFFDIAIEQPDKTISQIGDMKINISNLKKHVPDGMSFELLSDVFPFLVDVIGYEGITISPLPIPKRTLDRIIERGAKFYELFGWNNEQIVERSKVIASSEALVGSVLRSNMPNSIMIYTPTMLERAQVYSGKKFETDPLPIIFPNHDIR